MRRGGGAPRERRKRERHISSSSSSSDSDSERDRDRDRDIDDNFVRYQPLRLPPRREILIDSDSDSDNVIDNSPPRREVPRFLQRLFGVREEERNFFSGSDDDDDDDEGEEEIIPAEKDLDIDDDDDDNINRERAIRDIEDHFGIRRGQNIDDDDDINIIDRYELRDHPEELLAYILDRANSICPQEYINRVQRMQIPQLMEIDPFNDIIALRHIHARQRSQEFDERLDHRDNLLRQMIDDAEAYLNAIQPLQIADIERIIEIIDEAIEIFHAIDAFELASNSLRRRAEIRAYYPPGKIGGAMRLEDRYYLKTSYKLAQEHFRDRRAFLEKISYIETDIPGFDIERQINYENKIGICSAQLRELTEALRRLPPLADFHPPFDVEHEVRNSFTQARNRIINHHPFI